MAAKLIRIPDRTMTRELIEQSRRRRGITDVSLVVTTIALVASLVVAATVVSIGIARADTLGQVAADGSVRCHSGAARSAEPGIQM
jgi:hypothetical protein